MDDLSNIHVELAARIKAGRSRANLTQAELAAELDCSERSVQDWEAGRSFPRPAQRRRIQEFLDRFVEAVA